MPSFAYFVVSGEDLPDVTASGLTPLIADGYPRTGHTRWEDAEELALDWCLDAPLDMPIAILAVDTAGLNMRPVDDGKCVACDSTVPPAAIRVLTPDCRTVSDFSSLRPDDEENETQIPKRSSSPGF